MKPFPLIPTLLFYIPALVASFVPSSSTSSTRATTNWQLILSSPPIPVNNVVSSSVCCLNMVPRFDATTQRWFPGSEEESAEAGYPPIRSLLRHGPSAFVKRVTNPDLYDQAVLKFMANDNVGRWEAQGNMDRCNENAQDWMYERLVYDIFFFLLRFDPSLVVQHPFLIVIVFFILCHCTDYNFVGSMRRFLFLDPDFVGFMCFV